MPWNSFCAVHGQEAVLNMFVVCVCVWVLWVIHLCVSVCESLSVCVCVRMWVRLPRSVSMLVNLLKGGMQHCRKGFMACRNPEDMISVMVDKSYVVSCAILSLLLCHMLYSRTKVIQQGTRSSHKSITSATKKLPPHRVAALQQSMKDVFSCVDFVLELKEITPEIQTRPCHAMWCIDCCIDMPWLCCFLHWLVLFYVLGSPALKTFMKQLHSWMSPHRRTSARRIIC